MKLSQSRRGFLLAVLAGACLLPSSVSTAATTVLGSGPDSSFMVLQSPNLGARTYEIKYTFSSGTSQDGYFLLSQVLASDPTLTAGIANYGTASNPNYFLNQFTYNSVTEVSVSSFPYAPYWAQWVSGGAAGYPSALPVAGGTWTSGSGMSAPYRFIAPGSWDAFYYSDGRTAPSISPVPETSSALLAVLGSMVIFRRRRNG